MSDYFSPELIEKILLNLSVKPLLRFTTVCKSWRSIITSPFFISTHLHKPQNETLILSSCDSGDREQKFSLLEIANNNPFTIESFSDCECPFEPQNLYYTPIVGSCRGVLCLGKPETGEANYLWNPSIRKHVVLPMPTITPKEIHEPKFGFGVAGHDLKVVRLVFYEEIEDEELEVSSSRSPPEAEIFSLRTGRWRRLGADARLPNVTFAWCHVFLNGVMHWLARDGVEGNRILVFRVAQEVFDVIALPDELAKENLCLVSIGESLAVVQNYTPCRVWLMQAYGDESSWTRKYIFSLEFMERVVAIRKNGVVLVQSPELGLYALHLENVETKILGIQDRTFLIGNYVESLELLGCQRYFVVEQNEGAKEDLIGDGV